MLMKAERALASPSEESFAALVASVADYAIFVLDANGAVASWNVGAERIKGYRADEIVGREYAVFFTPEDRAAGMPERVLRAAAESGRFAGEGWRVRKDGRRYWSAVVLTALSNPDGSVRGYLKVTRDMSEQRCVERRVASLAEIGQLAVREPALERLFERASALVADAMGVEYVQFLELLPSGKTFRLVAGTGWKEGLVGRAMLRARAAFEDLDGDSPLGASKMLREHGAASGVTVSLACEGRPFGLIGAHSRAPRRFDADEVGFLQAVANVIATAVERRRAAERLRESEARLQAFMTFSPSVMFIKDRAGRYLHVNDEFLRCFGLRREQVIGRADGAIFPPAQAERFVENDAYVLRLGSALQVEETARYADGEHVSLLSKFPIRGVRGKIVAIGGIATDITERKRTERALHESRMLLANAQKLAGLGHWEWELESGRMTWSDQLYRIYDLTPGSVRPGFEAYLERVHPADRDAVRRALEKAMAQGGGFAFEERIVRSNGGVRHLRTYGESIRGEGITAVKLMGACLDVTEQVRGERALRASAARLRALAARLVAVQEEERRRIARELHDRVGQNLTALDINLSIAQDRLEQDGRGELRRRLEDSRAVVEATAKTIENVMAELRPPLLDEYGLAAALGWYAEQFSGRTGIATELRENGAGRGARDPEAALALFRIAQEALNNVAKHAHAGRIEIGLDFRADELILRVADDGAGFEQSNGDARQGWGMTTMRERAEAFGGRLEVESAEGRGTVVTARVKA